MGTRADFYVGRGEKAEWLGSIAWDGYPDGITPHKSKWPEGAHLFDATSEEDYRTRLARFFENRNDVTRPVDGWPWPWDDSGTSDYAYAFDGGRVYATSGDYWFDPRVETNDEGNHAPADKTPVRFPDMKAIKRVRLGGPASGIIVLDAVSP